MSDPSDATIFGPGQTPIPGPKGDTGDPGPANVLSIGVVTQGQAAASITGASPTQVLNLTLPEGPQGPQGIRGPAGGSANLGIGSVTSGANASASITGNAPNQVLNLVLPKGDTGATGPAGIQTIALLTRTTDQVVGAWPVKVEWQAATQDVAGMWTAANPTRLVVPAGVTRAKLECQASVTSDLEAGSMSLELYKNGSPLAPRIYINNGRTGTVGSQINVANLSSYIVPVVAGDYFEIQAGVDNLTSTTITAALSWLSIQLS